MMVPSGNGRFPSRKALIATSLPRMAPKLFRLPSSWATEINLQSRYPGGILSTKIGDTSAAAGSFAEGGLTASWGSAAGETGHEPAATRMRPQTPAAAEAARRLRRVGAVDPAGMVVLLAERTALALQEGGTSGPAPPFGPALFLGVAGGQQTRYIGRNRLVLQVPWPCTKNRRPSSSSATWTRCPG